MAELERFRAVANETSKWEARERRLVQRIEELEARTATTQGSMLSGKLITDSHPSNLVSGQMETFVTDTIMLHNNNTSHSCFSNNNTLHSYFSNNNTLHSYFSNNNTLQYCFLNDNTSYHRFSNNNPSDWQYSSSSHLSFSTFELLELNIVCCQCTPG